MAIYERLAIAWEERVGNLDRAADAYEQLLAIDPRNHPAYHLLARLYKQANDHEAVVETYRRHIAAMPDVETQLELYVAMGQVFETQLHDAHRAIQTYNEALTLDGRELRALDGLGRLYEDGAAWDHAVEVLGRLVDLADDMHKPELYWRMGRIQFTELGRADAAEASLLRAPRDRARPHAVDGGADDAVRASRGLAEGRADDAARRELLRGRGRQGAPARRGCEHLRARAARRRAGQAGATRR